MRDQGNNEQLTDVKQFVNPQSLERIVSLKRQRLEVDLAVGFQMFHLTFGDQEVFNYLMKAIGNKELPTTGDGHVWRGAIGPILSGKMPSLRDVDPDYVVYEPQTGPVVSLIIRISFLQP